MLEQDEKELVARAMRGDQEAYRAIFQLHERQMRLRVGRYLRVGAEVDDVVSESFQKAFSSLAAFDSARQLRPWLMTIACRTALDHLDRLRREGQRRCAADPAQEVDATLAENTPEEDFIDREAHRRLREHLLNLPPRYREVMEKYMDEELEYAEIARELHLELNTVRTRIRRGKMLLAERMQKGEEGQ